MFHYGSYSSSSVVYYYFYDINKNFISSNLTLSENQAFTAPALACYMKIRSGGSNPQNTYNHDICINISDATINGNYYPYEQDTLDIEADLNGVGTVSDEINVEEGKKYQRFGTRKANQITFYYDSSRPRFYALNLGIKGSSLNVLLAGYTASNAVFENPNVTDKVIGVGNDGVLFLVNLSCTSVEQLLATFTENDELVFELATPVVTDVEIENDGWLSNLIKDGSIIQEIDTTDTSALIAKEVDIAMNVVTDNQ
jgi:hypothetical protein